MIEKMNKRYRVRVGKNHIGLFIDKQIAEKLNKQLIAIKEDGLKRYRTAKRYLWQYTFMINGSRYKREGFESKFIAYEHMVQHKCEVLGLDYEDIQLRSMAHSYSQRVETLVHKATTEDRVFSEIPYLNRKIEQKEDLGSMFPEE